MSSKPLSRLAREALTVRTLLRALLLLVAIALAAAGCSQEHSDTAQPVARDTAPMTSRDGSSEQGAASQPARLIILISVDTLRADHLGLYGYPRFTSPNLDQLGASGTVFDDASATAPWTLPSHASILTGLYPMAHRVVTTSSKLPDAIPTLARSLAAAGYQTAAVVNSVWLMQEDFELTRDFEKFVQVGTTHDRAAPATMVTDHALEWIREAGDAPLFLFMHYYDVHADYVSLPAYEQLFVRPYEGIADGTAWQLQRANFDEEYIEFCRSEADPRMCTFGNLGDLKVDESVEAIRFSDADVQHLEDRYDAGIRQLDSELGRFLSGLQQAGLRERALLVITSDHGEEFMEHERVDHFLTQYQEVLHVPLIFQGPGIPEGIRVETPVSLVDIAPTLLALAGVPHPRRMDGLDLKKLWSGAAQGPFVDRFLYGEASGSLSYDERLVEMFPAYRSVRRGGYKLVHRTKGDQYALYDLERDPQETLDVSSAEPEIAKALGAELRARYEHASAKPAPENTVELDPEQADQLRALGYVP